MELPVGLVTRLCFIRHGETGWNAGQRVQGHIDIPLSATGHAQARAVANVLKDEGFAALYSSDLTRARQTAEATAHLTHLPIRQDGGLRERHFGLFQGLTHEEAAARHPLEYARHKARDPLFTPAGGESLHDFSSRLTLAIGRIAAHHAGETIALFTHGGVLDIIHRRATGQTLDTPRDFGIPNGGLNWIEIAGDHWTLLSWAERDHLDQSRDEL